VNRKFRTPQSGAPERKEGIHMHGVRACPIPDSALLRRYVQVGTYTDCYFVDVDQPVSQIEFVEAFYTTWLFRIERWILGWLAGRPSTDAQAIALALAALDEFAAWHVEQRSADQLLMRDYTGRTRSWLMSTQLGGEGGRSRLYFGSAVVPRIDPGSGESSLGGTFRALLGFHRCYSRLLLGAARKRLRRLMRGK
jgi:hypothetical protein